MLGVHYCSSEVLDAVSYHSHNNVKIKCAVPYLDNIDLHMETSSPALRKVLSNPLSGVMCTSY